MTTSVEDGLHRTREVLALVQDLCAGRCSTGDDTGEGWSPLTCAVLVRLCDGALADLRRILDHLPDAILNETPQPRQRRRGKAVTRE